MAESLGFISVKVIEGQQERLRDLCLDAGVEPMDVDKYHCTVCYDVKNEDFNEYVPMLSLKLFSGVIVGIKEMGQRKEGLVNALAFVLHSPELTEEHRTLLKVGHTHTFDEFIPHVSIAYDITEDQADVLTRFAKLMVGETLYFNRESIQPVK